MRTTAGLRVDVIYRRVDDDFLDPLTFRPDSALGVPGLMNAYRGRQCRARQRRRHRHRRRQSHLPLRAGHDPLLLSEEPILENVPTYLARPRTAGRQHVLANLDKLVVKAVNESGGYGMLMGPPPPRQRSRRSATC